MKLKPNIIIIGARMGRIGHTTLAKLVDVGVTIQESIEFKATEIGFNGEYESE